MRKLTTLSILVFAASCGDDHAIDRPPTVANQTLVTDEDTAATFTLAASDPDGDVTVTMSEPSHGKLAGAGLRWTYTPDPDFHGDDVLTATVSDGAHVARAQVAVTVASINDRPMLRPDSFAAHEDNPLEVTAAALLANDHDVDGDDTLSVAGVLPAREGEVAMTDGMIVFTPPAGWSGVSGFTYVVFDGEHYVDGTVTVTIGAANRPPVANADALEGGEDSDLRASTAALLANDSDPNGETLRVTAVDGAEGGTVALSDDTVIFTPVADFHGLGHFRYTVSDGDRTAIGLVDVHVAAVNDAPVAVADQGWTSEDEVLEVPAARLVDNDRDLDGDALEVIGVDGAFGGQVALADGVVTFIPGADFHGTAGFRYTISDDVASATAAFQVTVGATNDAPVAVDDVTVATEDVAVDLAIAGLLSNDRDVDADALIAIAVGDADGGTVAMGNGQTVTFTPTADFTGLAHFRYTISDGFAEASATVAIAVEPVTDAPVARPDVAATDEDVPLAIPGADLVANDTDVDGDTVDVIGISDVVGGTAVLVAGAVEFVPDADFHGTARLGYQISDGTLTAESTVIITVAAVNDAPVAVAIARAIDEDATTVVTLAATDVDGDVVTFAVTDGPSHGTLSGSGAQRSYVPATNFHGADAFSYQASDGVADSVPVAVSIFIAAVVECGDGEVEVDVGGAFSGAEACDDGNVVSQDGCSAVCAIEACGDGAIQYGLGETCDDGNVLDGDGCDATCQFEGGFVTTAPVLISGDLGCSSQHANTGRKIAVDSLGNVYAVMRCNGDAYLAASHDRGLTFAAPIPLGITGLTEVAVAAGGPGIAYVAATAGAQIMFTRTIDGGQTWSAPESLGDTFDSEISIEAFNDDVYVGAGSAGGIVVLHNRTLGAGAWTSNDVAMAQAYFDLIYDDRTDTLLVCSDTPSFHIRISTDFGVSFGAEANPPGVAYDSDWAAGAGSIFVAGTSSGSTTMTIIDADAPSVARSMTGLPSSNMSNHRSLAADPSGNAYVATTLDGGGVQLDRLVAAATGFSAPRSISATGSYPGTTTLPTSDGVAMVFTSGTSVYATIQVYPAD